MDPNTNLLTYEYTKSISEFMALSLRQPEANTDMLKIHDLFVRIIGKLINMKWFVSSYKIWYLHEETDYGNTSEPRIEDTIEEHSTDVDYSVGIVNMVNDVCRENLPSMLGKRIYGNNPM